eukprot:m.248966 g.248966  ORF g.248966 m.248966 type:complete len:194 (+) comp15903_c0_seq1:580-1161(+)
MLEESLSEWALWVPKELVEDVSRALTALGCEHSCVFTIRGGSTRYDRVDLNGYSLPDIRKAAAAVCERYPSVRSYRKMVAVQVDVTACHVVREIEDRVKAEEKNDIVFEFSMRAHDSMAECCLFSNASEPTRLYEVASEIRWAMHAERVRPLLSQFGDRTSDELARLSRLMIRLSFWKQSQLDARSEMRLWAN